MMTRTFSRFAAIAAFVLAASAAHAAELRSAVTVSGETVTLGDIFDNA